MKCITTTSTRETPTSQWTDAQTDVLSRQSPTILVRNINQNTNLNIRNIKHKNTFQIEILQSQSSSPEACDYTLGDEPCALEFLTHFMGDIHQPLHVSFAYDRGGNSVQVMFFTTRTNLHECWDTKMIQKWTKEVDDAVSQLTQIMQNNQSMVEYYSSNLDVTTMASESFDYVLNSVYDYTTKNGSKFYR